MKPSHRILTLILLVLAGTANTALPAATVVPAAPKIKSSSYLVMDYHSGRILVEENIDLRAEPASLTKMMTVYVVASELAEGNIHLDDMVEVSEMAWRMEGSRMFIEVGKQVTVGDLLKGVIIQSGNDASVALGEYVAGSEGVFAEVMNQHAARLGMNNSHFMNSTGLPHEEHYTTARDLAILTAALLRDFPDIYAWHSIREFTYNDIKQHNRNRMLWRDDSVDGVKTGHTEAAGYCLVASAMRDGMRLISVVMGADGEEARTRATQSILGYGFRFFETHSLFDPLEQVATSRVWKGEIDNFDLGVSEQLFITVPRGQFTQLQKQIEMDESILAPVSQGEQRGRVRITLDGEELASRPLIALQTVKEGSLFKRLTDELRMLLE